MARRTHRGAARASALLGALAALIALGLVVGAGYMLVTTAGVPPPPRPSAKPQPPPEPPPNPVVEEVKVYLGQVDQIMRSREIVLQALSEAVMLQGEREMHVDAAMSITVRRREITKDALEELLEIQPPGQAASIHDLYIQLLRDDIELTDQITAALRAGDAGRATQVVRTRDARTQETLEAIRAAATALGVVGR